MAEKGISQNETNQISFQTTCLSHKKRKALKKNLKRKQKRQDLAKQRDEELKKEEDARRLSPSFAATVEQEELAERAYRLQVEDESRRQHELWLWHEEIFKEKQKQKAEQEERDRQLRLETERKIKEEWEERQKKEKEEEEIKRKKKEKQDEMLRKAREGENKDGDWSNPLAPIHYGQERQIETCPFFAKVGACRFGDRCSRGHPYPDSGRTILFTGMFKHFQLEQGLCEEYDTDIVLEYEDSEVYQKFKEFYEDTLPEFKAAGHVLQFKVCCNYQPHLRGNVYISYAREEDTLKAYAQFNARWYGGKQISGQFVDITSWRRAICGLFGKGRCPKGKECNFLHVFKNPNAEFNMADRDVEHFTPNRRQHTHYHSNRQSHSRRSRSRSRDRSRRYSRSPSRSSRKYRHSRSRSHERSNVSRSRSRYSRSRSREKHSYSRSQRSRNDHRSSSSKYSRSRSRSNERSNRHLKSDRKKSDNHSSKTKTNSSKSVVKVDNIENYENSLNEEEVWVESVQTKDKMKKSKHRKRGKSRSRSQSSESSRSRSRSSSCERSRHKLKKKRKS